jgi:hypothetical protein
MISHQTGEQPEKQKGSVCPFKDVFVFLHLGNITLIFWKINLAISQHTTSKRR